MSELLMEVSEVVQVLEHVESRKGRVQSGEELKVNGVKS